MGAVSSARKPVPLRRVRTVGSLCILAERISGGIVEQGGRWIYTSTEEDAKWWGKRILCALPDHRPWPVKLYPYHRPWSVKLYSSKQGKLKMAEQYVGRGANRRLASKPSETPEPKQAKKKTKKKK